MECKWVEEFFMMGGGCPWIGFYLRTQIVGLVIAIILGLVAKKIAFRLSFLLSVLFLIASAALLFIEGHGLPHDFTSLHNPKLYSNLSNTSNHLFFYLLGIFISITKSSFSKKVNTIVEASLIRLIGMTLFLAGIVLVGFTPWVWEGAEGLEFILARIFLAILSLGLMMRCFRNDQLKYKGILHKLSEICIPVLMISSGLIGLTMMAVQGMVYTTSLLVIESGIGSLGICIALGTLVYLLTDLRAGLPK